MVKFGSSTLVNWTAEILNQPFKKKLKEEETVEDEGGGLAMK